MQPKTIEFKTVDLALRPPLRYLFATIVSANIVLYPIVYFGLVYYSHPNQFWLLLFLINLLMIPSVSVVFAIAFQVHKYYARRITAELNEKLSVGGQIPIAIVFPYSPVARLGLTAIRKATDTDGNFISVICFQRTNEKFQAYLWPVPTLVSQLNLRKQMFIAVPR